MSRTRLFLSFVLCAAPAGAASQEPPAPPDTTVRPPVFSDSTATAIPTLEGAIAARDSGDLTTAAAILRQLLERQPENGEATRILAQLLYWLKDVPAATALYETGMRRNPEDFSLQLDYGRMLVETRKDSRAVQVLTPLLSNNLARPRAAALLGTLAYWQGDLAGASRSFRTALAAEPSLEEARKPLDEIRALSAPWVTVGAGGLHDDQPLDRINGELEAGLFLTPVTTLSARVHPMRFSYEDELVACPGASQAFTGATCRANAIVADAGLSHYVPAARLETRIRGGMVNRSWGETASDWTGLASLKIRPAGVLGLEARAERVPYFSTLASLHTPVMATSGTVKALLSHPGGWLGEAAYRVEDYGDANKVRSVYAWSLAPLIRQQSMKLSAGYSIGSQDSDETRFDGLYRPYYTPENILSHSALVHLSLSPNARTTVTARGSYGFSASEDAPTALAGIGGPSISFARRAFNPWDAHVSVGTALTNAATLSVNADAMKTAFYQATSASVRLTYRFQPRVAN